jgi:hypothetical protein
MKTQILNTLIGFIGAMMMTFTSHSQTGKVWVSINDFGATGLEVKGGRLVSSDAGIQSLIANLNITSVERALPASKNAELQKVYEVSCNCDEQDLLQAVAKTRVFAKPELAPRYEALYVPNDYSVAYANDYALNLINAQSAWDITKGDSLISIAITDANYYYSHQELMGKYNYVGSNTSTDYTHGTAVAITAAGGTDNGVGKSSIGFKSSLQLRAMNYNEVIAASYAGARVINMSWASSCGYNYYAQLSIDEAYSNGSILVAAAGNGSTCGNASIEVYPAAFNHVISVSSVGPADNHERTIGNASTTHQHNASVDLCAPGYDVALSIGMNTYTTGNGSSFAAPYVSGTIALMLSVNNCLTSEQVEMILKNTCVNIDAQNPGYVGLLGAGRLDAGAAVAMAASYATMNISGTNTFNCETLQQGISLDLTGISSPYTIQWNNGATTAVLNNLTAGSYQAIVRDSMGCVGVYKTAITTLSPIAINATVTTVQCNGTNTGAIEVEAVGGFSNFTYEWTNGTTTQNAYNLIAGEYELTVKDGKGCTKTETLFVSEPAPLVATAVHTNINHLHAGAIDVSVVGGTMPYAYSWTTGATTEDLNGLGAGFYEVYVEDAKGCGASANVTLTSPVSEVGIDFGTDKTGSLTAVITGGEVTKESIDKNEITVARVEVYPNPAMDHATVRTAGRSIERVEVMTITGQTLEVIDGGATVDQVELKGLATGEYWLRVTDASGEQTVEKVVFM